MDILIKAEMRAPYIVANILTWSKENLRSFPWREDISPFRILIAEFLLRRTTATAVNRIYMEFITKYPTVESIAKADEEELKDILRTLGFHKRRSKMMISTSQYIKDHYDCIIPNDLEALLTIPNVGDYTAGAILSLAYGMKAPMVDSNVFRIMKRIFLNDIPKKGVDRIIREAIAKIIPEDTHSKFNLTLLDYGAKICRYGKPLCEMCIINKVCDTFTNLMTNI